uniref:Uncharacterized protein n=1 Tax=Phyllostachys edulis TaxID=38705 RepID=D3IVT6_PHYED|nr:hypothetical protein [Phyllostachys edulis]
MEKGQNFSKDLDDRCLELVSDILRKVRSDYSVHAGQTAGRSDRSVHIGPSGPPRDLPRASPGPPQDLPYNQGKAQHDTENSKSHKFGVRHNGNRGGGSAREEEEDGEAAPVAVDLQQWGRGMAGLGVVVGDKEELPTWVDETAAEVVVGGRQRRQWGRGETAKAVGRQGRRRRRAGRLRQWRWICAQQWRIGTAGSGVAAGDEGEVLGLASGEEEDGEVVPVALDLCAIVEDWEATVEDGKKEEDEVEAAVEN